MDLSNSKSLGNVDNQVTVTELSLSTSKAISLVIETKKTLFVTKHGYVVAAIVPISSSEARIPSWLEEREEELEGVDRA